MAPAVLTPGEFFLVHEHDSGLAGFGEIDADETHWDVVAVVAVLIGDDVAARLPERLASPDDTRWLTLELEHHLALQHIAEDGSGVPMRRAARMARWVLNDDRRHVPTRWDKGTLDLLHNGNRRLPRVRLSLLPGGHRLDVRHGAHPPRRVTRAGYSSSALTLRRIAELIACTPLREAVGPLGADLHQCACRRLPSEVLSRAPSIRQQARQGPHPRRGAGRSGAASPRFTPGCVGDRRARER